MSDKWSYEVAGALECPYIHPTMIDDNFLQWIVIHMFSIPMQASTSGVITLEFKLAVT